MVGLPATVRTCIICERKLQFKSIPLCLHEYWFTGAAWEHHTPVSVLDKVHHLLAMPLLVMSSLAFWRASLHYSSSVHLSSPRLASLHICMVCVR